MKARYIFSMVTIACIATLHASSQISCSSNSGREPLVCLVPFSIANGATGGQGQATQNSVTNVSVPINGSIASQLTQLPLPSGTAGTITLFEKGKSVGHPFDDLGPTLTERPETIGKGRIYAGFSYQHFNFNSIDGINLANLKFGYGVPSQNPRDPPGTFYYSSSDAKVNFRLDQYVGLINYGATETTDLSIVIPINSVIAATNSINGPIYTYTSGNMSGTYTVTPQSLSSSARGTASGIGDIKFGVKQLVYGKTGSNLAVALGFGLRVPSGNPLNFLGSGAYGADVYGLLSYRSYKNRLSPHVKVGKLWNGPSVLVNTNASGNERLPGGMEYDAGLDASIIKRKLTLAVDVIGNQFVNGKSLQSTFIALNPTPSSTDTSHSGGIVPANLQVDEPFNSSYTTVSLSGGLKYQPYGHVLLYGNVLLQLNNVGFRSDPVPLIGASYSFGKTE